MKFYFIRHGEGKNNTLSKFGDKSSVLTPNGISQANALTKRLSKLDIDLIISSTYTRAQQTAGIINESIKTQIILSDLLIERKRPSEVIGKEKNSIEVMKIQSIINQNYHDLDFHYSDEENFLDLKKRAGTLLNYLITLDQENILLVTHGTFMRFVFAYMLFGEQLTSGEYLKVLTFMKVSNTGVTVYEYNDETWRLLIWNDIAHLDNL